MELYHGTNLDNIDSILRENNIRSSFTVKDYITELLDTAIYNHMNGSEIRRNAIYLYEDEDQTCDYDYVFKVKVSSIDEDSLYVADLGIAKKLHQALKSKDVAKVKLLIPDYVFSIKKYQKYENEYKEVEYLYFEDIKLGPKTHYYCNDLKKSLIKSHLL